MADTPFALARIADALGISVEAFIQRTDLSDEQITYLRETVEPLDAWARIDDRQACQRCLSDVISAAERSGFR